MKVQKQGLRTRGWTHIIMENTIRDRTMTFKLALRRFFHGALWEEVSRFLSTKRLALQQPACWFNKGSQPGVCTPSERPQGFTYSEDSNLHVPSKKDEHTTYKWSLSVWSLCVSGLWFCIMDRRHDDVTMRSTFDLLHHNVILLGQTHVTWTMKLQFPSCPHVVPWSKDLSNTLCEMCDFLNWTLDLSLDHGWVQSDQTSSYCCSDSHHGPLSGPHPHAAVASVLSI